MVDVMATVTDHAVPAKRRDQWPRVLRGLAHPQDKAFTIISLTIPRDVWRTGQCALGERAPLYPVSGVLALRRMA
jgi:hypothetical protein